MNTAALDLNFNALLPQTTLLGFALLIMLVDMVNRKGRETTRPILPWLALVGALAAGGVVVWQLGQPAATFQYMIASDMAALALDLVVVTALVLGILVGMKYIPAVNRQIAEYYTLLLLIGVGMMTMGAALDLMVVFLGLEILSLGLFILVGLKRQDRFSNEAAMKYFLLGAFASGFFVYGAALVYGATGTTNLLQMRPVVASGQAELFLLYAGMALLIAGFGFKVSLVPFHMWTPDVYQGAPTPVTAFMSVGTKAAAFAAFYRLFLIGLPDQQAVWGPALAILAVVTMTLGNLAALRQTSLKRMLAYSSIAHAGYILVGLAPGTGFGVTASLFYLISYAFMNIGAFAVVAMLERQDRMDATYDRLKGMGGTRPWLAFVMAVFMLSLAGVPPLAGFFGKFFVFSAAVQGGYSWLAAIAMLNSAIGAYYYLRVVVTMYFDKPSADTVEATAEAAVPRNVPMALGLTLAVVFTVVLGVFPALWTSLFLPAVTQLTLR